MTERRFRRRDAEGNPGQAGAHFNRRRRPLYEAIYSLPIWAGLRDRATGPGDAGSGDGAWQASPGPTL